MAAPILLCTDGSELATSALADGIGLLGRDRRFVLVAVTDAPDPDLLVGSGHAGAAITPEQYDREVARATDAATAAVDSSRRALGVPDVEAVIGHGEPGPTICRLAEERSAGAIVMGTRGRGGVRRAFLGSVADHVVRNAPCTVLVTRERSPD